MREQGSSKGRTRPIDPNTCYRFDQQSVLVTKNNKYIYIIIESVRYSTGKNCNLKIALCCQMRWSTADGTSNLARRIMHLAQSWKLCKHWHCSIFFCCERVSSIEFYPCCGGCVVLVKNTHSWWNERREVYRCAHVRQTKYDPQNRISMLVDCVETKAGRIAVRPT